MLSLDLPRACIAFRRQQQAFPQLSMHEEGVGLTVLRRITFRREQYKQVTATFQDPYKYDAQNKFVSLFFPYIEISFWVHIQIIYIGGRKLFLFLDGPRLKLSVRNSIFHAFLSRVTSIFFQTIFDDAISFFREFPIFLEKNVLGVFPDVAEV